MQTIDSLHGKSFLAIQVATQELEKRKLSVVGYRVTVYKQDDAIIVIFLDQNRPADAVGSGVGGKPGFEVEMKADDLSVVRSHFVR